ncbi:cytochrome P450 [Suillus fuscotomentosus]|uniref:Cytochrome P450 n=1 Tax=Suillus fuscotomentosus TaxID=1912939 RepID=A0AAD4EME7_9AGAM|nr:cytochrome P450 [Suillus fuscotomentosus]KAG1908874.1 cytochrome P450 [Suillus fuscotomentosus]
MAFDVPESFSLAPTWIFIGAVIVVVLGEYCKGRCFAKHAFPLPPGPPRSWFWRSAMPSNNVTHIITQWIQQYGPVVSVRQGNQVSVIIGSVETANDIMEKEGSALVDRPQAIAAGEMFSQNMRLVLIRVGSRFRRFRKAANAQLQPKAIEAYRDIQSEDARQLVYDILKAPEKHQEHVRRFSNSVILRMTYGKSRPTAYTDPEVVGMKIAAERFGIVMQPGAFLVDRIPILRYVPWYGRQLKAWFREEYELVLGQMERVQNEIASRISIAASGLAGPSFMCTLLEQHGHQLSRTEMCYLGGTIFGAATDNISAAITIAILAAACHPEAQARVQEQLDTIVGRERAPSFEDVQRLTELHAFMHESLRWRPVVPLGFPHRATRDIIWDFGSLLAQQSTAVTGLFLMMQLLFLTPKTLTPRDGLNPAGAFVPISSLSHLALAGGQYLASDSILITLACLFWAFRILEPKDAPIDRWAFKDNVVAHPQPFSVMFFPRWDVGHLEEIVGQS